MPRILKDITIKEVSAVDRGAGRGVKVMLLKREDDGTNPDDQSKETPMPMTDAEVKKAIDDAVAAATTNITKKFEGDIAKRDAEITLLKMTDACKAYMAQCDEDTQKKFTAMTPEARDAYMAANPIKKKIDPATEADLAKRDALIADQSKQIEDMKKRLDAADLEKARADFKKRAAEMGLDKDGDGEILRKAYAGDKEAQAALEKRQAEVHKALTEQAKTGALFNEFGAAKGESGTAYTSLVAKAEEFRKTDAGRNLTKEQAFAKVYEDPANADLAARHRTEESQKRLRVVA